MTPSPIIHEPRNKSSDDFPNINENQDNSDEDDNGQNSTNEELPDTGRSHDGYQLLPQSFNNLIDPDNFVDNFINEDIEEDENICDDGDTDLKDIYDAIQQVNVSNKIVSKDEMEERKELWKVPRENSLEKQMMNQEEEERIKSLMNGFVLPPTNIPDWAKNIPDDRWKVELLSKLGQIVD